MPHAFYYRLLTKRQNTDLKPQINLLTERLAQNNIWQLYDHCAQGGTFAMPAFWYDSKSFATAIRTLTSADQSVKVVKFHSESGLFKSSHGRSGSSLGSRAASA